MYGHLQCNRSHGQEESPGHHVAGDRSSGTPAVSMSGELSPRFCPQCSQQWPAVSTDPPTGCGRLLLAGEFSQIFPGTRDPWSRHGEGQELQESNSLLVPGQGQAFRSAHSREVRGCFLMGLWWPGHADSLLMECPGPVRVGWDGAQAVLASRIIWNLEPQQGLGPLPPLNPQSSVYGEESLEGSG